VVGGLAVSVRAEPRFTRDIDLALAVEGDAQAEAVVHRLTRSGYRVIASLEQEVARRLATVRLETPGEGPAGIVVDLLFSSSGVEREIVAAADPIEVLPGLRVAVARHGHLLALKLLSESAGRPQDAADIAALLGSADPSDVMEARELARLIMRRGYARGRDLVVSLERHLGATGSGS
jgi:hypothetical protein